MDRQADTGTARLSEEIDGEHPVSPVSAAAAKRVKNSSELVQLQKKASTLERSLQGNINLITNSHRVYKRSSPGRYCLNRVRAIGRALRNNRYDVSQSGVGVPVELDGKCHCTDFKWCYSCCSRIYRYQGMLATKMKADIDLLFQCRRRLEAEDPAWDEANCWAPELGRMILTVVPPLYFNSQPHKIDFGMLFSGLLHDFVFLADGC